MASSNMAPTGEISLLTNIEDEGMKSIKGIMEKLYFIWGEFGLDSGQKEQRANTVWSHAGNLFQDILDEENTFYEEVTERIRNYKIKIEELAKELAAPQKLDVDPSSKIKTEESLRRQLDSLTKEKYARLKVYKDLKSEEIKLCRILGMPELQLSSTTGVPNESDVRELEEHFNMLKKEREKRRQRLYIAKRELTTIMETTELSPETSLEKEILSGKEDTISLTSDTFKALEDAICKHQKRRAEMETEKQLLVDKLHIMWERLKENEVYRLEFLSKHKDCKMSTLKVIQDELDRLDKLKKENTKMFVEMIRKELDELWDKCFIAESDRMLFHPYFDNQMTDSLLEVHETEAEKWRSYFFNIKVIAKKIEERTQMWERMIEFEKRVADPDRLKNNRGGRLLKEEKERKKFQKDLPALENEIFNQILSHEEETGKSFHYFGEDYRSLVTRQWEERNNQKENVKLERQKQHKRQFGNEVTLRTPVKRALQLTNTPKSAPSKLFKSTAGISAYPTPATLKLKVVPNTVGKVLHKNAKLFTPFIKSKNVQKKETEISNVCELPSTSNNNTTTYERFASLLNKTGKRALRSSVLSCRKSGGTRISQSNSRSKRKSANKSALRRSTRKSVSSASSTLTPARGKLGLPFLI